MLKRNKSTPSETHLSHEYSIEVDGFTIESGDIVKVKGERGSKFKFSSFVTNTRTGSQWVDCFETIRGQAGVQRSFKLDQIKRVPVRGKRVRRRKPD